MWICRPFPRVDLFLLFHVVFPSGWGFHLRKQSFPNHPTTIKNPNSYMLIPHSARNIAHYMEVYNIIYHVLHQPHRYPRVIAAFSK